jgi:hypothetical protein
MDSLPHFTRVLYTGMIIIELTCFIVYWQHAAAGRVTYVVIAVYFNALLQNTKFRNPQKPEDVSQVAYHF